MFRYNPLNKTNTLLEAWGHYSTPSLLSLRMEGHTDNSGICFTSVLPPYYFIIDIGTFFRSQKRCFP